MQSPSFSLNDVGQQLTGINICKAAAFLLGAHMLHIGIWGYVSPRGLVKAFGLRFDGARFSHDSTQKRSEDSNMNTANTHPAFSKEAEDGNSNFWPLLFAPREVGFGLLLLILGGLGEWRAVGVVIGIVAGILATTDGVVAGIYGKGGWREASTSHGLPAVVLAPIAVALFVV